jgi:hypothetical protein
LNFLGRPTTDWRLILDLWLLYFPFSRAWYINLNSKMTDKYYYRILFILMILI